MPATDSATRITPSTRARLRAAAHHLMALDPADVRERTAEEQYRIGATLWRHAPYGYAFWRANPVGPPALHSSPLTTRGYWMTALGLCLATPKQARAVGTLWDLGSYKALRGQPITPQRYGCARYYQAGMPEHGGYSLPRIGIRISKDPRTECPLVLNAMLAAGVRIKDILHWADGIYRAYAHPLSLYRRRMRASIAITVEREKDHWKTRGLTAEDYQWDTKATDLANDMGLQ